MEARTKTLLFIWAPCAAVSLVLVMFARRFAVVFADQGAFPSADLIAATPTLALWFLLAAVTLATAAAILYVGTVAGSLRRTVFASIACAAELLAFALAFVALPLIQWGMWLSSAG